MIMAVTEFLATELSLFIGQNLFISFMPDKPDECLTVYQYQGQPPEIEQGTGRVIEEKLAFQFVFRGNNYNEVEERADLAFHSLCSDENEFNLIPLQSPFSLGWKNGACKFSFNIRVAI